MDPLLDSGFICELLNTDGFLRYIGDRGVRTPEDAAAYIEKAYCSSYSINGHGLYTVELKNRDSSGEAGASQSSDHSEFRIPNSQLGICGLVKRDSLDHPDLGFAFLPEFEGNGYAFESSEAVLADGRERLGIGRVLAIATQDNVRSHRVLEKLGFKEAGLTKQPHDENELKLFRITLG